MDAEQNLVVDFDKGAAAVLAGAGSGKTSTLIGRIKQLSEKVDPKRIVMLTFTNSAADEMKERASQVNEACSDVIACTYHKYCGKMLRTFGKVVGIEPYFEVLTESKYKTLIEYVKSQTEEYEELQDFPSASKLASIFSTLVNNEDMTLLDIIAGTKYQRYEEEIKKLRQQVIEYGLANQKLCFDDMLVYMNKMLDNEDVCQKVAHTFDYLMVDEFQDTNKLQLTILIKLGKYNPNIVVVGDISQSIYKFRGARVENIVSFIKAFPGCQTFTLRTNYRSSQEILDVSNLMMNSQANWPYNDMKANNKRGNRPFMVTHETDSAQAAWILKKIRQWRAEGFAYSDIAIIERKSMSSFKLENELTKAHIPFEKRGGMKFTEYACVDNVLSFLFILTRNDQFSWFNVLRLLPGIGNKTAADIAEHCKTPDFLENYHKRKFYGALQDLQMHLDIFDKKSLSHLLEQVSQYYFDVCAEKITQSNMKNSAKFDAFEKLERDKKVIDVLQDMAQGYSSITSFLEDLALDAIRNGDEENPDHLIVTTIHSAKGLEWKKVIIIDCVEFDMDDKYEELRCMYVAMTRAKDELYMSIPQVAYVGGRMQYYVFIHFLDEAQSLCTKIRG